MKFEIRNPKNETNSKFEFINSCLSRISCFEFRASSKKGFTIVETLVAITILMIAVAGPLTIANQALHAAQDARNQLIATNLAQETLEEVRNFKDNNISGTTLASLFSSYNSSTNYAVEAGFNNGSYSPATCAQLGNSPCNLYLASTGYTYNPNATGGIQTPFSRWFNLTPISTSEYLLTVTVNWMTGGAANQVQIQDLLSANTR